MVCMAAAAGTQIKHVEIAAPHLETYQMTQNVGWMEIDALFMDVQQVSRLIGAKNYLGQE